MKKTPQHFKRLSVKQVIDKTLGSSKTVFSPLAISATESLDDDFTTVDFSFKENPDGKIISIKASKGKGFIDGLFNGMHERFRDDYPSLLKLKLTEFMVNPIMSLSKASMGTDAQASVVFKIDVDQFGASEFEHQSRSMIYSAYVTTLEAFQFYINCERAFDKIKFALGDAQQRNRSDTIQSCIYDLSKLTEVNSYEKKK